MSLYSRFVLPRLIDVTMRQKRVRERRAELVPKAHGAVLEVGIGSGLNFPYYGRNAERISAVDPSAELLAMARRKADRLGLDVELVQDSAERLPFRDASFDCAVMTWSLCSIPDPLAALREVKRVLRPGAELYFIEHGLSRDPGVAAWQRRLTPLWRPLAGGCHLDRRMDELIAGVFPKVELQTFYMDGPRILTYMYEGCARA